MMVQLICKPQEKAYSPVVTKAHVTKQPNKHSVQYSKPVTIKDRMKYFRLSDIKVQPKVDFKFKYNFNDQENSSFISSALDSYNKTKVKLQTSGSTYMGDLECDVIIEMDKLRKFDIMNAFELEITLSNDPMWIFVNNDVSQVHKSIELNEQLLDSHTCAFGYDVKSENKNIPIIIVVLWDTNIPDNGHNDYKYNADQTLYGIMFACNPVLFINKDFKQNNVFLAHFSLSQDLKYHNLYLLTEYSINKTYHVGLTSDFSIHAITRSFLKFSQICFYFNISPEDSLFDCFNVKLTINGIINAWSDISKKNSENTIGKNILKMLECLFVVIPISKSISLNITVKSDSLSLDIKTKPIDLYKSIENRIRNRVVYLSKNSIRYYNVPLTIDNKTGSVKIMKPQTQTNQNNQPVKQLNKPT